MHFHFQVLDLHELSLVELHCLLILRLFGCHVLTINLHPGKLDFAGFTSYDSDVTLEC